MHLNEVMFST